MKRTALLLMAAAIALGACSSGGGRGAPSATPTIKPSPAKTRAPAKKKPGFIIRSSAFKPNARIPTKFTCFGEEVSPPLAWTNVPKGTVELALIMDDPDAPGGTFTHWIVFAIPTTIHRLDPGSVPPEVKQGTNDFADQAYGGPCPPKGKIHRYRFHLHAVRSSLPLDQGARVDDVRREISKRLIKATLLVGVYSR